MLYRFTSSTSNVVPIQSLDLDPLGNPHQALGPDVAGIGDQNAFYYNYNGKVWEVDQNSNSPSVLFTVADQSENLNVLGLSNQHVVVEVSNSYSGSNKFLSIPKVGGAPVTLVPAPANHVSLSVVATKKDRLFYNVTTIDDTTGAASFEAVQQNADGSGMKQIDHASWTGATFARDGSGTDKIFLAKVPQPGEVHLLSYNADDGAQLADLGTVHNVVTDSAVGLFGIGRYGDKTLLDVTINRGGGASDENTYFVDAATAGSLHGEGATAGADETPAF